MKVSEISFLNLQLFPHTDNPFLQESELVEHRSSVGVGDTRKIAPASQGSRRRYPLRDRGTHRRGWSESCLASLTECYGRGVMTYAVMSRFFLEAQQSYLLFSLYSFSFILTILIFLSKHKILKIKEFQLKNLKFLKNELGSVSCL